MEAVFSTTNTTIWREAVPGCGFSFSSSPHRFQPQRAALLSPRKLADMSSASARAGRPGRVQIREQPHHRRHDPGQRLPGESPFPPPADPAP